MISQNGCGKELFTPGLTLKNSVQPANSMSCCRNTSVNFRQPFEMHFNYISKGPLRCGHMPRIGHWECCMKARIFRARHMLAHTLRATMRPDQTRHHSKPAMDDRRRNTGIRRRGFRTNLENRFQLLILPASYWVTEDVLRLEPSALLVANRAPHVFSRLEHTCLCSILSDNSTKSALRRWPHAIAIGHG